MMEKDNEIRCLFATLAVVLLTLLMCVLASCRTKKESAVDFVVNTSTAVRENVSESNRENILAGKTVIYDTVRETVRQNGQIDIERDTAGRPVKIVFEHLFDGLQTQGSSRIDTVFSKEVIIVQDSTASDKTDAVATGTVKEKKDVGINPYETVFLVVVGLGFIGALGLIGHDIVKWIRTWKK